MTRKRKASSLADLAVPKTDEKELPKKSVEFKREERKRVYFRATKDMRKRLQMLAIEKDMSLQDILEKAVESHLNRHKV